jgi:hypothetical protein
MELFLWNWSGVCYTVPIQVDFIFPFSMMRVDGDFSLAVLAMGIGLISERDLMISSYF